MLTILSPAKRLDWDEVPGETTRPRMQDQADILADRARDLSADDLKALMKLSDELAALNHDRFQAMAEPGETRPAIRAFSGDTYTGLAARDLSEDALSYAEEHLRILSGLYGVLRPMDAIRPYRLEMGTHLSTERGKSLYAFWGDRIAERLSADAEAAGTDILLNCASTEYFKAADRPALGLDVITPRFLDDKGNGPRVVGLFAKRARGAMARFVCEERITDPGDLAQFDHLGYAHSPEHSAPGAPAFLRAS